MGTLEETAGDNPEEGGDDVKSSCPYDLGYTCYNGDLLSKEKQPVKVSKPQKAVSVLDCSLQTRLHEAESLVIADQHAAV